MHNTVTTYQSTPCLAPSNSCHPHLNYPLYFFFMTSPSTKYIYLFPALLSPPPHSSWCPPTPLAGRAEQEAEMSLRKVLTATIKISLSSSLLSP